MFKKNHRTEFTSNQPLDGVHLESTQKNALKYENNAKQCTNHTQLEYI